MNQLLNIFNEDESFKKVIESEDVFITGLIDSQRTHYISSLVYNTNKQNIIITSNEYKAKEIYNDMKNFIDDVYLYPSNTMLFYMADAYSKNILSKRFEVIEKLVNKENITIILSVESLLNKMIKKNTFKNFTIMIKKESKIFIDDFRKKMIEMGYENVDKVDSRGEFSIKGGIIDIFPVNRMEPVRLDLFDDEIETIKKFNVDTQISTKEIKEETIYPCRELLYTEKEKKIAIENIKTEYEGMKKTFKKRNEAKEAKRLKVHFESIIESLENNIHISSLESFISYFYDENTTLIDYIDEKATYIFDSFEEIQEKAKVFEKEFNINLTTKIEKGNILPGQADLIFDFDKVMFDLKNKKKIYFDSLNLKNNIPNIDFEIDYKVPLVQKYNQKIEFLIEEVKEYLNKNYKILFLAGTRSKAKRIKKEFLKNEIEANFKEQNDVELKEGKVILSTGSFKSGFEYPKKKFLVISDREFFGQKKKKRKIKRDKYKKKIESFTDLNVGDYVVHNTHGIGIYKGIEKIKVENIKKDYIKIEYANNGFIFLPPMQLENLSKYIGAEGKKPKISNLNGTRWKRKKEKAKKAVKKLAKKLIKLYAKRETKKGYVYGPDSEWQEEFEDSFIHEETEDQLIAINDVKEDMESSKIMDRLICGDVGYGKTEVAIRAAFKAVQDNKQVAYLVPTTILAEQHYKTFKERMGKFPVNIEVLSRFKTKKEQKKVVEKINSGLVDIIIGTHRILSKDLEYNNLGLVIIDEEQRFGVAQKERLKEIAEKVDVISLTATPIPRTLHMSLSGIRDISILKQPPKERIPVQTYVMEKDDLIIKEAIYRELSREGQVFFLHNKVKDIEKVHNKISKLVPEARVIFAHGQMSKKHLEKIMIDFVAGNIDVLICTTIIETGIDIKNVNTLIIDNADKMGLSQLYQIRGRVGRSDRLAYAYLMYEKNKVLNEDAKKRLHAIKQFTEFGAGFKIAMRDLEIRGAGNLIGKDQHGHMELVGYEMYCNLLEEAVNEEKGVKENKIRFETKIELDVSAYIPKTYINDSLQKLEIYKKISNIKTTEDLAYIKEELLDRFGDMSKPVKNLLEIAKIKAEANNLGIKDINQLENKITFTFINNAKIDIEGVNKMIGRYNRKLNLEANEETKLIYKNWDIKRKEILKIIKKLIKELKLLKN